MAETNLTTDLPSSDSTELRRTARTWFCFALFFFAVIEAQFAMRIWSLRTNLSDWNLCLPAIAFQINFLGFANMLRKCLYAVAPQQNEKKANEDRLQDIAFMTVTSLLSMMMYGRFTEVSTRLLH
jgi:hypothetical protein